MKRLILTLCSLALGFVPVVSQAVGLSPSVIDLAGVRGETLSSRLTVTNTAASEQTYYFDILDFIPGDETGTPSFLPASQENDLPLWITLTHPQVAIPAYSKIDVPFQIIVPQDQKSGSYYAAISVSPAPKDVVASNGAIIEARTAALVMLTIKGETIELLQLLDFTTSDQALDLGPKQFQLRLQNQGNVHEIPLGTIQVRDWMARILDSYEVNPSMGRVLPGSTRTFDVVAREDVRGWYKKILFEIQHFTIGPVTASLHLTYGETGVADSIMKYWILPWHFILVLLGLGALLWSITHLLHKKTK